MGHGAFFSLEVVEVGKALQAGAKVLCIEGPLKARPPVNRRAILTP